MALLKQSQLEYYTDPTTFGNYQFVSLEDIINQFMIIYVGEEKIISKVSRTDVAFHAQRALAELSFDTFKCVKSQEISLPPSLTMILPHDYVNYTKISWSDSAGIKHPLYPTSYTSNPFKIIQNDDKSYDFTVPSSVILKNGDFGTDTTLATSGTPDWFRTIIATTPAGEDISVINNALTFTHGSTALNGTPTSRAYACWQEINVEDIDLLDLSALGTSAASATGKGVGTLRVGLSTLSHNVEVTNPNKAQNASLNNTDEIYDVFTIAGARALITFNDGAATASTGTLENIDVSGFSTLYVLVTSFIESFIDTSLSSSQNIVDDITLTFDGVVENLQQAKESTTWNSYKTHNETTNSDIQDFDYNESIHELNVGQRYGIEPSFAQTNGSFYIDHAKGLVHFSSNVSGKTVILDYISDSLGTEGEMQVHKFAEEAMYKYITHAVLSSRSNTPEYLVSRYKKERFAAVRQAKLRLSNLKIEDITNILRGKSKWIKH
tara:strand:+ start:768 stop:2249 length:1482 start_codon:yes stop_codon:yes gene_type:complete